MGDGAHADVPGLAINAVWAVAADPAGGFVNLIGEGSGDEHLREQRIGIECNAGEQIVQLIGLVRLISPLVLRGLLGRLAFLRPLLRRLTLVGWLTLLGRLILLRPLFRWLTLVGWLTLLAG